MEIYTCLCKNKHRNSDDLKHFLDSKFECFSQNPVPSSCTSVNHSKGGHGQPVIRVKTSVLDSEKNEKIRALTSLSKELIIENEILRQSLLL